MDMITNSEGGCLMLRMTITHIILSLVDKWKFAPSCSYSRCNLAQYTNCFANYQLSKEKHNRIILTIEYISYITSYIIIYYVTMRGIDPEVYSFILQTNLAPLELVIRLICIHVGSGPACHDS